MRVTRDAMRWLISTLLPITALAQVPLLARAAARLLRVGRFAT